MRARRFAAAALVTTAVGFVAAPVGAEAGGARATRVCDTAPASSTPATYTVAKGDGWFQISRAAGVSLASLFEANGATARTVLHPGSELCLPPGAAAPQPTSSACSAQYAVRAGDSWSRIAQSAGLATRALLDANRATSTTVLHPGKQVCIPAGAAVVAAAGSCVAEHPVAAGESWYVISRATGVPMEALFAANNASAAATLLPGRRLCLPAVGFGRDLPSTLLDVAPVRGACRFANSWNASRGGGRTHVGADLISPSGTPVLAVANGTLTRQTRGARLAGNAWWLTTSSGTYFFYAHLSQFASGLSVGSTVRAGDVIGYVGATGNAVSPHLHFEIHPRGGGPINPYAAIWMAGGCEYDRRYEQAPLS